jgi:hypothetical protein
MNTEVGPKESRVYSYYLIMLIGPEKGTFNVYTKMAGGELSLAASPDYSSIHFKSDVVGGDAIAMWFSRSSSRRPPKVQTGEETGLSPTKPLLEPQQPRSREPSPTKASQAASSVYSFPTRPDYARTVTTPTEVHQEPLGSDAPPRLSFTSSVGKDVRGFAPGNLLQPPSARSQRHPSTVNLPEEGLEGTDRLFDPFSGRPLATLHTAKPDALQPITPGMVIGNLGSNAEPGTSAAATAATLAAKHRSSGDMEDPSQQKMWEYLARIRSLQAEVASMHLTMDGQGLGDPWGARAGGRSRSGSVNQTKDLTKSLFVETPSSISKMPMTPEVPMMRPIGDDSDDEKEGDKKGKKNSEEFSDLNKMFEKKQEALKSVMEKVQCRNHALLSFFSHPGFLLASRALFGRERIS